jgi:branched-chain amino acid transport system substrate-binding protein
MMRDTVFLTLSLFCLPFFASAEPLRIGALLDLSKVYAPHSQAFLRGAEIAAEEINAAHPKTGLTEKIELFPEDTQYNSTNAVTAAQKLITQSKVAALLTITATEHKAVATIAKNSKVLAVDIWDSSPEIESFGEYSFGFGPWTPATGEKTAEASYIRLGAKSAYIVTQQDEWSEQAGDSFQESFKKLGGTILAYDKLDPSNTDFRSTITKIRASKADLVFFPIPINISEFIKQAKQQNLPQKLITADVISNQEIKNSQGAAEGVYHMEADPPDSSKAQELYRRYKERYGTEPELKQFLSWGYDAIIILSDSWARAKAKSGQEFADAVRATTELEGATGKLSVTEKGSVPKYPVLHQIRDGNMVTLGN